MANSPKDDTDLSAIPLKKLDAILNQIQKQNALISEQGSQINELSTENEKLRSELKKREELLARANAENKRRNEIVEGFKYNFPNCIAHTSSYSTLFFFGRPLLFLGSF